MASVSKSLNGKKVNRIAALRKTNTLTTVAVMVVSKHFGCSDSSQVLLG